MVLLHARPIVGTTQLNKLVLGPTHNRTEQTHNSEFARACIPERD